jgi:hypothetical protein
MRQLQLQNQLPPLSNPQNLRLQNQPLHLNLHRQQQPVRNQQKSQLRKRR